MRDAIAALLGPRLPAPVEGVLERLLVLDRFNEFLDRVRNSSDGRPFLDRSLANLNIRTEVSTADLALVPKQGPVVVVANHPFGLVEGMVLAMLLRRIRSDVKIMANYWLSSLPGAAEHCIFVDPFGGPRATRANQKGLKECISWLERGGVLAVFPAGEVAHLNLKQRAVIDPDWNQNVARIVRITKTTVPGYFRGANSAIFQLLGFVHPKMRTALLAHEFLNKSNRGIEVRIGSPISPEKLRTYQDDIALTRYLRHRTYLLQNRKAAAEKPRRVRREPIASPPITELIAAEIAKLAPERTLVDAGALSVLIARAHEIPNGLREIGRLRELTFREVGEGTGRPVDLDSFDDHYWHLFVWNRTSLEIVGAYRLGLSDEILGRAGIQGFYTNSLFDWTDAFLDQISPAMELGRSWIRLECQKSFAPLLLLWKGIGQFLIRNPQYKVLFGPVSISNEYSSASRQLMVTFLNEFCRSRDLARLVRPRNPYRRRPDKLAQELVGSAGRDIEDLSALIADVEVDHKGVPILLKQYLKLGGELVTFSVDRKFAYALDGLIVVDLRKTDLRLLERYMGKEGAAAFRCAGEAKKEGTAA